MKTTVKMNFEELENVSGGKIMMKPPLALMKLNETMQESCLSLKPKKP